MEQANPEWKAGCIDVVRDIAASRVHACVYIKGACCEPMAHDGDGERKLRNGLICRVMPENVAILFAKVCSRPYLFSVLSSYFLLIKNVPKRLPYTKIVDKNTENVKIFCAFRYFFVTLQHSVE